MVECRGSRVIRTSRVEGHRSRVESRGRGSKVEVEGQKSRSRAKSRGRGSKVEGRNSMGNINFLLINFKNTTFLAFVIKILKVLLITNFITVSTEHAFGHN